MGVMINRRRMFGGKKLPYDAEIEYLESSGTQWDGDELLIDFIPVRVGNVGYMYDKVTKQLFGNQGTGDFILGPDK